MTAVRALSALLGVLIGLSLVAPSYAASPYPIPSAIASDCSVDVTLPIRAWVASVPDNSTLSFGTGACYRIDGTLTVPNRHGLQFEGNGATFRAVTPGHPRRSQWRLAGGSSFAFRSMTIRGASPVGGTFVSERQYQHAFDLRGVTDVELDHIDAFDLYGDCVYVGQGWDSGKSWSRNVHVQNSTCTRNGRMGIAVVAGRDVLVETSGFHQIGRTAFDIEPNGPGFGARNIAFTNNLASGVLPGGFFTAIGDGPIDSVQVSGNRMMGAGMYMAVLAHQNQRRTNITIVRNSSDTGYYAPRSAALDFERVDGLTVTQNNIPLSGPAMALAWVSESCNVNISQNTFSGGVVETRMAPYPCTSPAESRTSTSTSLRVRGLRSTSTALHVKGRQAGAGIKRRSRTRRAYGRVRGSKSGPVVIRVARFSSAKRAWVKIKARKVEVRRGRFATRLRGLGRGRWRARATFGGTRERAASESRYRYFRVR